MRIDRQSLLAAELRVEMTAGLHVLEADLLESSRRRTVRGRPEGRCSAFTTVHRRISIRSRCAQLADSRLMVELPITPALRVMANALQRRCGTDPLRRSAQHRQALRLFAGRRDRIMSSSQASLLPHATRELARFAATTSFDQVPGDVIERIKLSLLDGLGVCLHGSTLPWTRMVHDLVREEGGKAAASVWGSGHRTSLTNAVLANSTAGHAFEMDDIHKESIIHPNSLAVPVVLALAEADPSVRGRDVALALAVGYEVGLRIGNAATMSLFLNGFHPQGTSGAFVAAAAAGKLLELDAGQMQNALGIAGSMAAGLMAAQEGAMVKRLHAGRAAQGGLMAALLARRGFTGISDVVEAGYGGFLSSFSRTPNPARLLDGLGHDWEAGKVGFKMYPNVTSIHAALDAFRSILIEERLAASDIGEIHVGCGHMTFVHTAWEYRPAGVTAAQMNMYYGLSVMALRQDVSAADYREDTVADSEVLAFIPRIRIEEDDELERRGAAFRHAARIRVLATDGRTFTREVLHRRGSPENPVERPDIERKFNSNVERLLKPVARGRLVELCLSLEKLPNVAAINRIMAAPLEKARKHAGAAPKRSRRAPGKAPSRLAVKRGKTKRGKKRAR
jgi:2-methylcitrate dehydratase PrpD